MKADVLAQVCYIRLHERGGQAQMLHAIMRRER